MPGAGQSSSRLGEEQDRLHRAGVQLLEPEQQLERRPIDVRGAATLAHRPDARPRRRGPRGCRTTAPECCGSRSAPRSRRTPARPRRSPAPNVPGVHEREVRDVEEVVRDERRPRRRCATGGSQAPTYAASSTSGSSNKSTIGGSGASQMRPHRSWTACGTGVTSSGPARRSVHAEPSSDTSTGSRPTSLDSATGCQARRSSSSTLDDSSIGAPSGSGLRTHTAPSSTLTAGPPVRLARGGTGASSPSEGTATHVPSAANSQPW